MIINYKNIPEVLIHEMRGGVGCVTIQRIVEDSRTLARITIPPKASIGPHTHVNDEEYVVVEAGIGECFQHGVWEPLTQGMVHLAKKGDMHSIRNLSNHNLIIIVYIYQI
ncbi:MAG: cupin domain-containing protein [Bacilli bacterium]